MMKLGRPLLLALCFALVHLILSIFYANATPYRTSGVLRINRGAPVPDVGAPDERQHANYVQTLMEGHLPVFQPGTPSAGEHYEDHQPPLYYVLAAGWGKLAGVGSVADAAGIRLRYLNGLVGAGTVLGVFFLALWGYKREDVAVGAAALAALLPMNCALSGAISNDPLLFALCTWTLAFCALSLRDGWTTKRAMAAGVLTGLAILTKTTAVALLPVLLLAVLIPQAAKPNAKQVAIALAALLVLALPWLARNQSLYGDPLALKAFNQAFSNSPSPAVLMVPAAIEADPTIAAKANDFIAAHSELATPDKTGELMSRLDQELGIHSASRPDYWINWVGWWTTRSFVGVFGYMDIWLSQTGTPYGGDPNTIYRLVIALILVHLVGWLLSLRKPEWRDARPVQWLNLAFLALVVLSFVRFNLQYFQGQGRYMYPAVGPICVGMSVGAFTMLQGRGRISLGVVAAVFIALNVYALSILPGEFAKRTGVSVLQNSYQSRVS